MHELNDGVLRIVVWEGWRGGGVEGWTLISSSCSFGQDKALPRLKSALNSHKQLCNVDNDNDNDRHQQSTIS